MTKYSDPQTGGLRTFRDTIMQAVPRCLQGKWGSRLMYSLGIQLDGLIDGVVEAAKLQFPEKCVPSALSRIGRERGIGRGLAETDEDYARRLVSSIDCKRIAGSPFALLEQLQGWLHNYPTTVRVWTNPGVCYSMAADGTKSIWAPQTGYWNWDNDITQYWRYWVVIHAPKVGGNYTIWTPHTRWSDWTSANWAGLACGTIGGATLTTNHVSTISSILYQWNPPHAHCQWVIIPYDTDYFDPAIDPDMSYFNPSMPDGDWGKFYKVWSHNNWGYYARNIHATYLRIDGQDGYGAGTELPEPPMHGGA